MSIKIAIADDHPLSRQGLREYLRHEADIEVVADVASGDALLRALDDLDPRPDVAIVDARMPGMDGIEATRLVTSRSLATRVLVLSAFDDPQLVLDALAAGARGYVLKTRDAGHITRAVRLVADGDLVIDPEVVRPVIRGMANHGSIQNGAGRLSVREKQVLTLLSDGRTNKQIATALRLSPETVKACLTRIFFKLGAHDRAEAVAEALRLHAIE